MLWDDATSDCRLDTHVLRCHQKIEFDAAFTIFCSPLQLLVSLDGFSGTGQVVTICATNRIDTLDKALTRPGRFDRKLCVELPSFDDRIKILKVSGVCSRLCTVTTRTELYAAPRSTTSCAWSRRNARTRRVLEYERTRFVDSVSKDCVAYDCDHTFTTEPGRRAALVRSKGGLYNRELRGLGK